jgi:hypothetical protein
MASRRPEPTSEALRLDRLGLVACAASCRLTREAGCFEGFAAEERRPRGVIDLDGRCSRLPLPHRSADPGMYGARHQVRDPV